MRSQRHQARDRLWAQRLQSDESFVRAEGRGILIAGGACNEGIEG